MAKRRQPEVTPTWARTGFDTVVGAAKQASEAVVVLSDRMQADLSDARTERGRKKVLARLEQDVWTLLQQPSAWFEASTRSALERIRCRVNRIERRLDALEEAERAEIPPPEEPENDWDSAFVGMPLPELPTPPRR